MRDTQTETQRLRLTGVELGPTLAAETVADVVADAVDEETPDPVGGDQEMTGVGHDCSRGHRQESEREREEHTCRPRRRRQS